MMCGFCGGCSPEKAQNVGRFPDNVVIVVPLRRYSHMNIHSLSLSFTTP